MTEWEKLVEEIREKLKEIANGDNIDTLVEVMRILEGWNDGRTADDI